MIGWITEEKSNNQKVQNPSSQGVQRFIQMLKLNGCNVEKILQKNNRVKIVTKDNKELSCLILSQNNANIWQPYISTIAFMDQQTNGKWNFIGLNYINGDDPNIYIISSDELKEKIKMYENNPDDYKEIGLYKRSDREYYDSERENREYYEINAKCMKKIKLEDL